MQRLGAPAAVAAGLFLVIGGYGVFTVSQHHDEDVYVWASDYLVHQIATVDTKFTPDHSYSDPHWSPQSHWSLGMGTSTKLLFGLGLVLTPGTAAPGLPYSWVPPSPPGSDTTVASGTLIVIRFIAVLSGAIGIALIARRLGWPAVVGGAVVLLVPGGIATFSRAWAEGPLLLAFGLIAAAYGTRWFAPALGLGLTFKLTALGLWPLVFIRRARVIPLWKALTLMIGTFVLLTPPTIVAGGPIYIVRLIQYRGEYWAKQSTDEAFIPSRYFWPFELAAVIIAASLIARLHARRRGVPVVQDAPSPT